LDNWSPPVRAETRTIEAPFMGGRVPPTTDAGLETGDDRAEWPITSSVTIGIVS